MAQKRFVEQFANDTTARYAWYDDEKYDLVDQEAHSGVLLGQNGKPFEAPSLKGKLHGGRLVRKAGKAAPAPAPVAPVVAPKVARK
jgi:hypothetical protein